MPTLVVVVLAILAQHAGLGEILDRRLHDGYVRVGASAGPEPARLLPDVAVVTIDPRSLRASEPWPWSRSLHATAVDRLEAAGARAIAFDIDFSSASTAEHDARLAESLRASGQVVLAAFSQTQTLESGVELEIVNRPIAALEQSAAALGSVLVPIDSDGVVRHAPRASSIGGEPIRSLARAALRVATPERMRSTIDAAQHASAATRVDFRRAFPAIPTIAYIDLVEGRFDPQRLAGRAVFIGATAAEFQDLWSTPVAPALPGVMIQAIAYRTAAAEATGESVLSAPEPGWLYAGYLLLGLATLPRPSQGRRARATIFLGTALGIVGLGAWAFWSLGLAVPATVALGLVGVQYTLGIERLQQRIRLRVAAQDSSLRALARIGHVTSDGGEASPADVSGQGGLELAMGLLGEVVAARGVVLMRARPDGRLTQDRLEWHPGGACDASALTLDVDDETADRALAERRVIETQDAGGGQSPVVYSPLVAGSESVGVLVVICREGQPVDSLQRRTIATVGAQLALTAQNLRLIDRLRETFESSIAAVASAVEARDGYTDQHCRRLAAFSSLMGARLGMPEDEIRAMELGALLHDVGKIGIPDSILNKSGHLSGDERVEMQRHPEIGAGIIAPVVGLEPTTLHCVVHHHERWDGCGYPQGLEAEEIPLAARIVAIVDVWDALSTSRPYKPAYRQAEVRDLLLKGRGTQFDPDLVDLFFEVLTEQGEEMLELIARSSTHGGEIE